MYSYKKVRTCIWMLSPAAKRQFFAADSGISYVCIQVKENSLEGFTADDAVIC